ncbi:phosphonate ABC transporter, periplasmic phosphonate-binding protein [Beutenbergia cavernae DSM 12333]|uniref:Phosphonate ABC transporter, periplasmic phosphonate-binding protein n=1 Tax=Beutenbergia cavernae (strain ATCC BAA-8 / DSM 12333 / CCUG 43141 / JCM 11478 / NBRC 16432 / NCIMB 13614 / HKI 0122) TaxID=471853 RepID=C5BXP0_BEUC1|nr:phosphate/phosphite/phosphonate ABC transporter substrate-binding protein [Beutenbergia cavernae]ACQ80923.1 phosphonate ABC transporter, periplasmic phosphonate-binding protein [Beutenbergia cavernae DSM 12333]
MKRSLSAAALAAATALVLAACGSGGGDDDATGGDAEGGGGDLPDTLVLGLVPSVEVDALTEDASELAAMLSDELGVEVEAEVTTDFTALVVAMGTGQADIGMFGPIALVNAVDQSDAVAILQSVRFGSSTYHTQWFTNDPGTYCLDEAITVPDDEGSEYAFCNGAEASEGPTGEDALALVPEGAPISFVDAASASGYYYPATQLGEVQGIDPVNDINTVFAGGHPNSVQNVARGDAPVGVSFNDARTDLIEEDPEIGTAVTVFASSPEIPNDGVAVSGELSEEAQQQIADAFLAIAETDEGLAVLDAVYSIEGLVPADLEALDAARQVAANFGEE